jgi:hypothetical protein
MSAMKQRDFIVCDLLLILLIGIGATRQYLTIVFGGYSNPVRTSEETRLRNRAKPVNVHARLEVFTALTMDNVFWDIKTQSVLPRSNVSAIEPSRLMFCKF